MTERNHNLVVPLAQKATAMRTTETSGSSLERSSAVSLLIGESLRQGDVDSTMGTLPTLTTPGIRTSTTATRTTTPTTSCAPEPSADYPGSHHADLLTTSNKKVLDPCCGSRMMWFDRQHPDVVFGDKRIEQHILCDGRTLRIEPDIPMDFTSLPFKDGTFRLVAFDPPHLHTAGPKSWMAAKYGKLTGDWREDLRKGFAECFRVLASDGVLVFKWNETQVKVREVLALTPVTPLFGHPTGRKGITHWYVFMKPAGVTNG